MATASLVSRTPWWVFAVLLALAAASAPASAQCTFGTAFGSGTVNPSGAVTTLSSCSFPGEYSVISGAINGETLRFSSGVGTDFITLRSGTFNGPLVAFGASPMLIDNTFTGTLYAHWSTNASCGTQPVCRLTTVQLAPQCNFTRTFGAGAIDLNGNVVTLSTCMFPGEYSTITGAVDGQKLRISSNVATDFIIVRSGTSSGPVVASGRTPLVFSNTVNGAIFAHWSADSVCSEESACRVTTVQLVLARIFRDGFE